MWCEIRTDTKQPTFSNFQTNPCSLMKTLAFCDPDETIKTDQTVHMLFVHALKCRIDVIKCAFTTVRPISRRT